MNDPKKRMTVAEFRELGYVQELNRRFLHPLGLALEVTIDSDGTESIQGVWDYRDDPEGLIFGPGIIDAEKAKRVYVDEAVRATPRLDALGFVIQPEN